MHEDLILMALDYQLLLSERILRRLQNPTTASDQDSGICEIEDDLIRHSAECRQEIYSAISELQRGK